MALTPRNQVNPRNHLTGLEVGYFSIVMLLSVKTPVGPFARSWEVFYTK